jgi:hypothetical protein
MTDTRAGAPFRLSMALLAGLAWGSSSSCAGVSGQPGASPPAGGADAAAPAGDAVVPGPADSAIADLGGTTVDVQRGIDVGSGAVVFVYAHTSNELYHVNPDTLAVSLVGAFFQRGADMVSHIPFWGVTDIAVDHMGAIIGVTFNEVLRIDPATAECTTLAPLVGRSLFNGLSWVTQGSSELLVATASDGTVSRVDPMTGAVSPIGMMGQGVGSSGDLVSVAKFGTLATVKTPTGQSDWLASLDPATGQATLIGAIGFRDVLGIGFWKDRVFGFTQGGQFILIDPMTGVGTMASQMPGISWWGAGVTTAAFVIP